MRINKNLYILIILTIFLFFPRALHNILGYILNRILFISAYSFIFMTLINFIINIAMNRIEAKEAFSLSLHSSITCYKNVLMFIFSAIWKLLR